MPVKERCVDLKGNSKTVLVCQECGDRTTEAIWKNGIITCNECNGVTGNGSRGKPMARSWDEFNRQPRKRQGDG